MALPRQKAAIDDDRVGNTATLVFKTHDFSLSSMHVFFKPHCLYVTRAHETKHAGAADDMPQEDPIIADSQCLRWFRSPWSERHCCCCCGGSCLHRAPMQSTDEKQLRFDQDLIMVFFVDFLPRRAVVLSAVEPATAIAPRLATYPWGNR